MQSGTVLKDKRGNSLKIDNKEVTSIDFNIILDNLVILIKKNNKPNEQQEAPSQQNSTTNISKKLLQAQIQQNRLQDLTNLHEQLVVLINTTNSKAAALMQQIIKILIKDINKPMTEEKDYTS